jgi:hypothetical protein
MCWGMSTCIASRSISRVKFTNRRISVRARANGADFAPGNLLSPCCGQTQARYPEPDSVLREVGLSNDKGFKAWKDVHNCIRLGYPRSFVHWSDRGEPRLQRRLHRTTKFRISTQRLLHMTCVLSTSDPRKEFCLGGIR